MGKREERGKRGGKREERELEIVTIFPVWKIYPIIIFLCPSTRWERYIIICDQTGKKD